MTTIKRGGSGQATGERELIERIRGRVAGLARVGRGGLRLGIGDDCALLRIKAGEELAVTTDLALDGRHFRLDWHPAESVGHRTLARGLSDLAAMGARPVAAFLSLGLPPELTRSQRRQKPWVDRFYDGLLALAEACETPLAGGDLAESPLALADIVLVGAVRQGQALLRSGARAGEALYVTGRLGGATLGLELLAAAAGKPRRQKPPDAESALGPHLYPQPRLEQGQTLARRRLATAAMDLSDGLSLDLARLCAESGVAAEVEAELVPCFPGATLEQALHGGEDYELLFTARAGARVPRAIAGVPLTRIGQMVKPRKGRPTVTLVKEGRREALAAGGWEHFAS
jgi:thiamine-monophosphate kinase